MEYLIKFYFTNIDLFSFKRHNINVKHIWSFKKNGNSLGGFVTQTSLTYFRKKSGILDLRTGKDNKFISVFLQRDISFKMDTKMPEHFKKNIYFLSLFIEKVVIESLNS